MTHKQLEYFLKTAEHMNITTAARELFISQPSLSEQIKSLEKEIGVELFDRKNRNKLTLTNAGKVMVQEATELLQREQELIEIVRKAGEIDKRKISICYLQGPYQNRIPLLIKMFQKKNPGIAIELNACSWNELNSRLEKRNYDVIFYLRLGDYEIPGSSCIDLYSAKSYLIASEDHPLAIYDKVTFEQFRYEVFSTDIMPKKTEVKYNSIYEIFANHKAGKPNIIPAPDIDSAIMNVRSGISLGIVSPDILGRYPKGIKYIECDEFPNTTLCMYWNEKSGNKTIKELVKFASDNLSDWFE